MAKQKLRRLWGHVHAPEGKLPLEIFEEPETPDPDSPPKKNNKDDLIYRGVGRIDRFAPPQTLALANSIVDRYSRLGRHVPQELPSSLNPEAIGWAEEIRRAVFGPLKDLKLLKTVAEEAIASRKGVLDLKGYDKPEDPEPVIDDGFHQVTAAIGQALTPLLQELAMLRAERNQKSLQLKDNTKD